VPIAAISEWITLSQLATHLNVDYDTENTDQADELTGILEASVAWVEKAVHQPILDRDFRVLVRRPGDRRVYSLLPYFQGFGRYTELTLNREDAPIMVPARGVRGTVAIAYWESGQTLDEAPTGTVRPGRIDTGNYEVPQGTSGASILTNFPMVFPPSGGWPQDGLDNSPFVITGSLGFQEVADIPKPWRIAVLHIASSLYETQKETRNVVMTARRMLEPWVFKGVAPETA